MAGLIIWGVCSAFIILYLVRLLLKQKQDIYSFSEQLEKWLDDMINGNEIITEDDTEDTLYGKINEKIGRANHIRKKQADEIRREKENIKELIADISHQTKTPIANLKIYLELLDGEAESDKAKEFVENLVQQTEKLDFLLQSLIKMSRMETGIIRIQKQRTPLPDTLSRAVSAIVPRAEEKQLCLTVDCEDGIVVNHDSKWTEEAIFNILDNAVKYTECGGNIHIAVSVQEIFTRISIRDSGKGIAPKRQAEIFTRFYREPEVHNQDGAGIGLYLARKIIELENGYIEVDSKEGCGSDFRIYLPNDM